MNFNFKKLNLELKHKTGISAGFFIFILAMIIFLVIFPSIKEIKRIKDDIYAQKVDLEIKYKRGQDLRKVTEKLNLIKDRLFLLDNVFVKKENNLQFITKLEEIAEKNNISQKINIVSPEELSGKKFQEAPLNIIASGSLSDQLNYLSELENLPPYINIYDLSVSSGPASKSNTDNSGTENNQVSLNILSKIYWLE